MADANGRTTAYWPADSAGAEVVASAVPRLQSLDFLRRGAAGPDLEPELSSPVDLSRLFICETLTPLYYTSIYRELGVEQRRRYNQIAGMCQLELITFIEETFADTMLPALARNRSGELSSLLRACLEDFQREESRHTAMFHRLKRLSCARYATRDYCVLRLRPLLHSILSWLTRHPLRFPWLIWLVLILEECSIEVARRCARMGAGDLEPRYASVYRAHLADEMRHVQLDWHLLELFYAPRGSCFRRVNAAVLRSMLSGFFMWPKHLRRRLARLLVEDCPELAPALPRMLRELDELERETIAAMMFSGDSHRITYSLFDRFPEFRAMQEVIPFYRAPARERGGS